MKEKTFMKKHGMLMLILGVAAVTRLAGLGKLPGGVFFRMRHVLRIMHGHL